MSIEVGTITDRGLNPRRTLNEDRFLADPEHGFFAVCDGVGGHNSGEVASQKVVDTLAAAIGGAAPGDREDFLELSIQRANRELYEMARRDRSLEGMATTVAALWLNGREALVAHVGDSRVYQLSNGKLSQVTADHSVVGEAMRAGQISSTEAAAHPLKHVISRAIGVEPQVEPEFNVVKSLPGDTFLLCSDGISGHVESDELATLLQDSLSPQDICDRLREICYERGASDNLTAVVIRIDGDKRTAGKGRNSVKPGSTQVFKQSQVTGPLSDKPLGGKGTRLLSEAQTRITVTLDSNSTGAKFAGTENQSVPQPTADYRDGPHNFAGAHSVPSITKRLVYGLIILASIAGAFYGGYWYAGRNGKPGRPIPDTGTIRPQDIDQPQPGPSSDPAFIQAAAAFNQGRWEDAQKAFIPVAQRAPQNGELQYWVGRCLFEQHNYVQAVDYFQRARTLGYKGTKASTLLFEALCQSALRHPADADAAYRRYAAERLAP